MLPPNIPLHSNQVIDKIFHCKIPFVFSTMHLSYFVSSYHSFSLFFDLPILFIYLCFPPPLLIKVIIYIRQVQKKCMWLISYPLINWQLRILLDFFLWKWMVVRNDKIWILAQNKFYFLVKFSFQQHISLHLN
jgi:hypothetical protein